MLRTVPLGRTHKIVFHAPDCQTCDVLGNRKSSAQFTVPVSNLVSDGRFVMLSKKLPSQLRLALLRVAFQTTKAFSHYYTSLESLLKAKWQMMLRR
jgi:hypothetical protein